MVLMAATWAWSGEFDWKALVVMIFAYSLVMGVLYLREVSREPPRIDEEQTGEIVGLREEILRLNDREADDEYNARMRKYERDCVVLAGLEEEYKNSGVFRYVGFRANWNSEKPSMREDAKKWFDTTTAQRGIEIDPDEIFALEKQGGPLRNKK